MEEIEDLVVKCKRGESVVHLINSDIDIQEKLLIRNEGTKGLDRLTKTEREKTAEPIENLIIDGVDIKRKEDPRAEVTIEIEEKGFTQDNDGCIIIESVDLKAERNEAPGNDPLEDGDGGYKLENEMCLVKLEDSKVYLLEDRAHSTWMNEAQVLDFENNSGQVLESDGVVTYLGESERDITEREDNIVNCQRNEKGGQGILKSKDTRNNSLQNKPTEISRILCDLRNVYRQYKCIDSGSCFSWRHRELQNCTLVKSVCEHCGDKFSRKDFKQHLAICATKEKYKCQNCSEKFTSRYSLLEHYETHAGNDTSTVSQIPVQSNCKNYSSSANTITSGENVSLSGSGPSDSEGDDSQSKFKCQECDGKFSQLTLLVSHSLVAHPSNFKNTEEYNCKRCSLTFESQAMYIEHLMTHSNTTEFHSREHMLTHSKSKPGPSDSEGDDSQSKFKCQECDRKFSQLTVLVSHSLVAHPSKFKNTEEYNCKRCSLTFESQAMYIEHLMTHSNTTELHSSYKYIKHMLTHSKSKPENNETKIYLEGDYYDRYIKHMLMYSKSNPVSPAISSQQSSEKQNDSGQISSNHLGNSNELSNSFDDNTSKLIKNCTQNVEKHSDLPSCQGTSDKHHKSNSSEDSTSLKHNLNVKIPSRPGTSNVHIETPPKIHHSQAKNKRRLESIDAGDSPYKIPKCPKEIESEENKKLHECVSVNFKEELYVCQTCHKAFKTQQALSAHEPVQCKHRNVNASLEHKPIHYKLNCQQCGKLFQSNVDLYNHIQVHPNMPEYDQINSKYQCWMCLKVFSGKKFLRNHTKGTRLSKCSVCTKSFFSACSLSKHMNTHNTTTVTPQ